MRAFKKTDRELKIVGPEGQDVPQDVPQFQGFYDRSAGVDIYFMVSPSLLHHMQTMFHHASCVCPSLHPDEDPLQPVTSDETVSAGGTVTLTCRVAENDNSSLQWSNTAQQTLYFGDKRGKMKHIDEENVLVKKAEGRWL